MAEISAMAKIDDGEIIRKNLEMVLEQSGMSPTALSRAIGRGKDYIRDALAGRKESIKPADLRKIERELGLQEGSLSTRRPLLVEATLAQGKRIIPIMGTIGAGGLVDVPDPRFKDSLFDIEGGSSIDGDPIGFQTVDQSMYPRYKEGEIAIADRRGGPVEDLDGREAIVRTDGGKYYLRTVTLAAAPNLFDLEVHNAPTMRGVHIVWGSRITQIIPSGSVKKFNSV